MIGTGLKMFAVLMLALLPMGVVAIIGTIQTVRTAELERSAMLRLETAQGASRLLSQLNQDRAALRLVANLLEENPARGDLCARAAAQIGPAGSDVPVAAVDGQGRRLCGSADAPAAMLASNSPGFFDAQARLEDSPPRLFAYAAGKEGRVRVMAAYRPDQLERMAGLVTEANSYQEATLSRGATRVLLSRRGQSPPDNRLDRVTVPLNMGAIDFEMRTRRPPVSLIGIAAMALPIFMWIAAAGIGWWVVNRFLIRPLIAFNRDVAAYRPGAALELSGSYRGLAREIDQLGDTFREIAQDVVEHEGQLADALAHQRSLTREVHHRVKNNLQIIASLINLHSRSAVSPEASRAYASIQRRVDALSVVHRNHYAAAELSQGIHAPSLISELASALRATGPVNGNFTVKVDSDNLYLSQDVAVPVAFLITELVEMVMLTGDPAPTSLSLRKLGEGRAALSVTSASLRPSPEVKALLADRFDRILVGLSRQLRAALDYDAGAGCYTIEVAARA